MFVVHFSNRLYNLIPLIKDLDTALDETSRTDTFHQETGHIQHIICK